MEKACEVQGAPSGWWVLGITVTVQRLRLRWGKAERAARAAELQLCAQARPRGWESAGISPLVESWSPVSEWSPWEEGGENHSLVFHKVSSENCPWGCKLSLIPAHLSLGQFLQLS